MSAWRMHSRFAALTERPQPRSLRSIGGISNVKTRSFAFLLIIAVLVLALGAHGRPTDAAFPHDLATPSLTWGDNDCSGAIAALDALPTLVYEAEVAGPVGNSCPPIGQGMHVASFGDRIWGDLDCSGHFDAPDLLLILRYVANLPPANLQDCPALGIDILLQPG